MLKSVIFQDETTEGKILELLDNLPHGEGNIDIDVADVKTILDMKGTVDVKILYFMSKKALERTLNSLSREFEGKTVQGVLALYEISKSAKFLQLMVGLDKIYALADEEADIIFGTSVQEDFADNEIKVTLLINIQNEYHFSDDSSKR